MKQPERLIPDPSNKYCLSLYSVNRSPGKNTPRTRHKNLVNLYPLLFLSISSTNFSRNESPRRFLAMIIPWGSISTV